MSSSGSDHKQDKSDHRHSKKEQHGDHRTRMAVDIAYTLNHALVCTLTDPLTDVPIGALTEGVMRQRFENQSAVKAGVEGAEHKTFMEFARDEGKPAHVWEHLKETVNYKNPAFWRWVGGELTGDFGAVAATVAIKHGAPGVSESIQKAVEPLARPLFKRSIEKSAKKQFLSEMQFTHFEGDYKTHPRYQEIRDELYHHEMKNLPNALLWTILSPTLNVGIQTAVLDRFDKLKETYEDPKTGLETEVPLTQRLKERIMGKAIGSVVTSGLTLSLRRVNPRLAANWDHSMSQKVGGPITDVVSDIFGVDQKDIEEGLEERFKSEHSHMNAGVVDTAHLREAITAQKHDQRHTGSNI